MSIDETTVEAIKSAIASFDEGELNGWELGVLLARAERDAVKLRSQEARLAKYEAAIDSQKEAYEVLFRIFNKRLQAAEAEVARRVTDYIETCASYELEIKELRNMIKAADAMHENASQCPGAEFWVAWNIYRDAKEEEQNGGC